MARTGPQKIPGARFDLFFGDGRYSGSDMEVNTGLLHTTEGAALYDYDGGGVAPQVTGVPDFNARRLVWHQHFDVDESSRALVNAPGGVQTNTLNVFQVELVGTCDPVTHADWTRRGIQHVYWPEPPDWAVRDLAWLMRWLRDEHGIPLTSGLEWLPYPASYGASRARMSFAQWTSFRGWCGHQHVPENDHGDPGKLPIGRLLAVASGQTLPTTTPAPTPAPVPSEEDDMPYSEADLRRFIREEAASQPVRDANAYANAWFLAFVLSGQPIPGDPWGGLPEQVRSALVDLVGGAVWSRQLPNPNNLDAEGRPRLQPAGDFQVDQDRKADLMAAQGAAQMAAISALATELGKQHPEVNVDGLVARIEQAIAGIGIRLTTTKES
nr:hypothetical protein KPHV_60910 [Kitasatospora purpeofusca]